MQRHDICPFGLPAGMHAEAAWNTVSVADLSVLVPYSPSMPVRMFDAWYSLGICRTLNAAHVTLIALLPSCDYED